MLNKNNTGLTIQQIKDEIDKLKGKKINMVVNQGRKKYVNYEGIIQDTYKSIFVVKLLCENENIQKKCNIASEIEFINKMTMPKIDIVEKSATAKIDKCNSENFIKQKETKIQGTECDAINSLQRHLQKQIALNDNSINQNKQFIAVPQVNENQILYDENAVVEKPKIATNDLRTYSYIDILCGNVDIDGFDL